MLKDPITFVVQSATAGPHGAKLKVGSVVTLADSPYLRILIKSGNVSLVDPPSLDPEYLRNAGYELREGYKHPEAPKVEEAKVEETKVEEAKVEEAKAEEAPVAKKVVKDLLPKSSEMLTRKPVVEAAKEDVSEEPEAE